MKYIICSFLLLAVFSSCKRDKDLRNESASGNDPISLLRTMYTFEDEHAYEMQDGDMDVAIVNTYTKTSFGEFAGNLLVTGSVQNMGSDGRLAVNSYEVPLDGHTYIGQTGEDSVLKGQMTSLTGTNVVFRLSDNSTFNDFSQEMYVPTLMDVEPSTYSSVDRNSGMTLTWTPDASNNNNPIVVLIQYNPLLNHNDENVNLPTSVINRLLQFNESDQKITITAQDLTEFPTDGRIDLYIGRGNSQLLDIGSKKLHLLGLSVTTIRGLLVQ